MGVRALTKYEEDVRHGKDCDVPAPLVTILVSDELADPHFVVPEYLSGW